MGSGKGVAYLGAISGMSDGNITNVTNNATIEYDEKKLKLSDLDLFVAKAGFKSLGIDSLEKERKKINGRITGKRFIQV